MERRNNFNIYSGIKARKWNTGRSVLDMHLMEVGLSLKNKNKKAGFKVAVYGCIPIHKKAKNFS